MSNSNNYYRPSMFGGFQFFPPVVKSLLLINGLVFLFELFFGGFHIGGVYLGDIFTKFFALWPLDHGFMPWQLITYQFMHAGFLHLLFNMLFGLWMFGMEVEHVWGSKKFLIYYLFCGVAAGLTQLFLAPVFENSLGCTVGASGAIYGVLIAFAVMFPNRYVFLYFLIPIKVKYFVIGVIVIGALSVGGQSDIANLAHLGGALAGYLYILIDRWRLGSVRSSTPFQTWTSSSRWSRPESSGGDVVDAKIYDISESRTFEPKEKQDEQKRLDEILDKISRDGYQSLTDEEKKILFETSKKMN